MGDDMLEYQMEVKTPKKARNIYSNMFAKQPKSIYQCGKPGNNAGDCKVTVVVVKENLTVEDSRQGEANRHVRVIDADGGDLEANFTTTVKTVKICEYAFT